VLAPGAIVDPEDLRVPGEQPGTPIVVLEDLGEVPHGFRFRARQGKRLLLLTVLTPEVVMQRELRDLLAHRLVQAGEVVHPNLLPTYGFVRLPLVAADGSHDDEFDTLFLVRPDPGCPTLRQWLHEVWAAGHVLDPLNAVAIAVQVCEALAVVHERCAHGYVTADNVFMYPTGGMPQALLSGTGEGVLLPFAPNFQRFVDAGLLPIASRELYEPPHQPRVETDVLGVAALIVEILTGRPLQPGAPLDLYGLPPRLARVLSVAAAEEPDDRPKEILMFSRRLQAAVGLGEDPTEPSAVLEPVSHGEHADPRYPAVRAQPWRPPPPPPPPWAAKASTTPGSGAWNVGAPVPGSGAWNVGTPVPGSGAWNVAAPTSGSGGWNLAPRSGPLTVSPSPSAPPPAPPTPAPRVEAPAFGRDFPKAETMPSSFSEFGSTGDGTFDAPMTSPAVPNRVPAKTKVFAGPPPPPVAPAPSRPPPPPPTVGSVSIVMPAPDGSVLAAIAKGPRDYWILRRGKAHGPYDLGQLERLIPMGKLLSVDTIQLANSDDKVLAVDLPGLRPLFEAKARESEPRPPITTPPSVPQVVTPAPAGRGALWVIVALLTVGLLAAGAFIALGQ
jgi:hypothetical protein